MGIGKFASGLFTTGHRIFGFENIQRAMRQHKRDYTKGANSSIAKLNRWTGKPHEHKREITRRKRQRHV